MLKILNSIFHITNKKTNVKEKLSTFDAGKNAVENYQMQALGMMLEEYDFSGKCVLEIGGSNLPRDLVFGCLDAKKWVCVDYFPTAYDFAKSSAHYTSEHILQLDSDSVLDDGDYVIYDGKVENIPKSFFSKFDVVISLCAFEHFLSPVEILQITKKCLRQGGAFFTYFGPVWSCSCGHHCWVTPELNFNSYTYLPEFCHLLLKPDEMEQHLLRFFPLDIAKKAVTQIYTSDRINRLFYDDYVKLFEAANFSMCRVSSAYELNVESSLINRLKELYPQYSNFTTYNIYAHCKI